jgi:hypothetical protein
MNLYIEPAMDREEDENFELKQVNFTWKATGYKDGNLEIKLNFASANQISPLIE